MLEPIWELFSVMFLDYLRVLGCISGKRHENSKTLGFSGVLRSGIVTPRSGEGPRHGEGFPRRSVVEKENGPA